MAHVLITGGTGFIGSALVKTLLAKGQKVTVLTRDRERWQAHNTASLNYISSLSALPEPESVSAVVNLAGEPLNSKRWNDKVKAHLQASRVDTTNALVDWAERLKLNIPVWINGSAIGWYGPRELPEPLSESSGFVPCFTHDLCAAWEQAADQAAAFTQRLVKLRIGIVLEADGGPLAEMLLPFKLGLGGPMGHGRQMWSWVHRADLIRLIEQIIDDERYTGPINATAPEPLSQREFAKTLARTLKRPCFAPVPGFVASLMLGEFAQEVLLKGQCVLPEQAQRLGFEFKYPKLDEALANILS